MGFIVFELDASLFCFVSRAIRGANCRSYAIAFCFLLLPSFLHDPPSSQPSGSPPPSPPPCSFARRTPTDTTDHDADREGRLSHSPHSLPPPPRPPPSLSLLVRSSTLEYSRTYALPLVAFSSHPTSSVATRRTCHSVPFPFLVERSDRFLCRVLLFIFRVLAPTARDWFFLSYLRRRERKREKEDKAVTEKRAKGGTF